MMMKALLILAAYGTEFLASIKVHRATEPVGDFDSLNPGTKEYFESLDKTLWQHPWRRTDFGVFEEALKEWYAHMISTNCGGMPSRANERKRDLTEKCYNAETTEDAVFKLLSKAELQWYKTTYPADLEDHFGAGFKQIMHTLKALSTKELLCMTLFTIDDNCVDSKYIRVIEPKE